MDTAVSQLTEVTTVASNYFFDWWGSEAVCETWPAVYTERSISSVKSPRHMLMSQQL